MKKFNPISLEIIKDEVDSLYKKFPGFINSSVTVAEIISGNYYQIFANFETEKEAINAVEKTNGILFCGQRIQTKHKAPTPLKGHKEEVKAPSKQPTHQEPLKEHVKEFRKRSVPPFTLNDATEIILRKFQRKIEQEHQVTFQFSGRFLSLVGNYEDCSKCWDYLTKSLFCKTEQDSDVDGFYTQVIQAFRKYPCDIKTFHKIDKLVLKELESYEFCDIKYKDGFFVCVGTSFFLSEVQAMISKALQEKFIREEEVVVNDSPRGKDDGERLVVTIENGCSKQDIRQALIDYANTLQEKYKCKVYVIPPKKMDFNVPAKISISHPVLKTRQEIAKKLGEFCFTTKFNFPKEQLEFLYEHKSHILKTLDDKGFPYYIDFTLKLGQVIVTTVSQEILAEILGIFNEILQEYYKTIYDETEFEMKEEVIPYFAFLLSNQKILSKFDMEGVHMGDVRGSNVKCRGPPETLANLEKFIMFFYRSYRRREKKYNVTPEVIDFVAIQMNAKKFEELLFTVTKSSNKTDLVVTFSYVDVKMFNKVEEEFDAIVHDSRALTFEFPKNVEFSWADLKTYLDDLCKQYDIKVFVQKSTIVFCGYYQDQLIKAKQELEKIFGK